MCSIAPVFDAVSDSFSFDQPKLGTLLIESSVHVNSVNLQI